MIYVDEIRQHPSGEWCHMWTDGDDTELDRFAYSIGLKRSWSHTSNSTRGRFYHYDLRPSKRVLALKKGANFLPLREWIMQHMSG